MIWLVVFGENWERQFQKQIKRTALKYVLLNEVFIIFFFKELIYSMQGMQNTPIIDSLT